MYCVKCRKSTETSQTERTVSKNNRHLLRGKCVVCGTTKTQFVRSGGSILNKVLNNLPFELHLPGHNFTGPGTKLNKRLNSDLTPKAWSKPINRVDNAAYHHDVCYLKNSDTKYRNEVCDKNMLSELDGIYNPSIRERLDRSIVDKIIGTKIKFGMGAQKKKADIKWSDKLAEELHKPVRHTFPKRRVYVKGLDEIWAADLIEMRPFAESNNGVNYLLAVIDIFSKYAWLAPLKNKKGDSVANALQDIFETSGRKPNKMWVDDGKEFWNKNVRSLVELYSTKNEEKSCVVERLNRTLKEDMWKYFSANNTFKYIDILQTFVDKYNNEFHESIKMTPIEASNKKNENLVWRNLYGDLKLASDSPKYAIGDKVRITKKKRQFEKGYTPNWTEEIFTISKIQYTDPITYKIIDYNNEEIEGTFYEQELQKSTQEVFHIEKVIRKRGNKSLVKWKGYSDEFNSWIDNKDLV